MEARFGVAIAVNWLKARLVAIKIMSDINICCALFYVIDCVDAEEHRHIGCDAKSGFDENPIIDNEYAKEYCLSEQFKDCPYYPKRG